MAGCKRVKVRGYTKTVCPTSKQVRPKKGCCTPCGPAKNVPANLIYNLNASWLTSGTIDPQRLPSQAAPGAHSIIIQGGVTPVASTVIWDTGLDSSPFIFAWTLKNLGPGTIKVDTILTSVEGTTFNGLANVLFPGGDVVQPQFGSDFTGGPDYRTVVRIQYFIRELVGSSTYNFYGRTV